MRRQPPRAYFCVPTGSASLPGTLIPASRVRAPMAAADAEKEATARFLREHFRRHYASTKLVLPDRYARREFGFMFFQAGIVQRHLGFSKEDDLREFLVARTPAHAYYSSAHYETPDAPTMEEKGWLGAELVFALGG